MSTLLKPSVNANDHIRGNINGPIELVEYGDFECSDCGKAYSFIKVIQQEMGDDLKFIFRNFPLAKIHPHAINAALAAEAAALQNKFWEMHDMIFNNQKKLELQHLLLYAKNITLDLDKFKHDMQEPALLDKIEVDFEGGIRSGVNGTPSFFVNGLKYNRLLKELSTYLKTVSTRV